MCYEPIETKKTRTIHQLQAIDVRKRSTSSWINDATRLLALAILEDRPFEALKLVEGLLEVTVVPQFVG